ALRAVAATPLASLEGQLPDDTEYARLSSERGGLQELLRRLQNEIAVARAFESDEKAFSVEATEQRGRLKTIGIFADSTPGESCPLCSRQLEVDTRAPAISQLKDALASLSSRLEAVQAGAPRLQATLGELQQKLAETYEALATNRAEMEAVRA